MAELEIRGPFVAASYYDAPDTADRFTNDGWFKTGDVASIDSRGYIRIRDRAKDVIKSGGEWISSVALENAIMGIPAVAEAAVVGISHPGRAAARAGSVARGSDVYVRRDSPTSRSTLSEVVVA
jgi:fatty-acyl-CoA synthase